MGGVLCGRRCMLLTLRFEGSQRSPGRSKTLSHFGCVLAFFRGGDSICGMCIGSEPRVFCEAGAMNFVMAGITCVAFCHFRRQHFMHKCQCIVHFSDGKEFGCIL